MARPLRTVLPNVPLHLVQRGNNRQACFVGDQDYRHYLKLLATHIAETGCSVHAYVLMTNHVHLLVSPPTRTALSALMKCVGQRYTQYFNRKYERTGTLWQGRFRSCLVDTEEYFLACQRYIELNPVRARMAPSAGEYRWTSYHANGKGHADALVTPHPIYLALNEHEAARRAAYRALFSDEISEHLMAEIRQALRGTRVLGNAEFAASVKAATATPRPASRPVGRPPKQKIGV